MISHISAERRLREGKRSKVRKTNQRYEELSDGRSQSTNQRDDCILSNNDITSWPLAVFVRLRYCWSKTVFAFRISSMSERSYAKPLYLDNRRPPPREQTPAMWMVLHLWPSNPGCDEMRTSDWHGSFDETGCLLQAASAHPSMKQFATW